MSTSICKEIPNGTPYSALYSDTVGFYRLYSSSTECYNSSNCPNWSTEWSTSCQKIASSTTDQHRCNFPTINNTSNEESNNCPDLSLKKAKFDPVPIPQTLPTPLPFTPSIAGQCEGIFMVTAAAASASPVPNNPAEIKISNAGTQIEKTYNNPCGCITICVANKIFRNGEYIDRPNTCQFSKDHPPTIDIPETWLSDPSNSNSISCAEFFTVDYRDTTNLGCASNGYCSSYGMDTVTNDTIENWMGKDSNGKPNADMCNLYLNATNTLANLSSVQQTQCASYIQQVTQNLASNKSWCDLTSDTLNKGYFMPGTTPTPGATPSPILGTRTGFCLP